VDKWLLIQILYTALLDILKIQILFFSCLTGWHFFLSANRVCRYIAQLSVLKEFSMPRPILDESRIHPAVRQTVATHHTDIVAQVEAALAQHAVLVVGMAMNPMPKKARAALDAAGVAHGYLEFGSYFNTWRKRNALKMWTGWPTFPMVFVKGSLVGGASDLQALIASGELKKLLA
jgi:monothiol glutaredoxin